MFFLKYCYQIGLSKKRLEVKYQIYLYKSSYTVEVQNLFVLVGKLYGMSFKD